MSELAAHWPGLTTSAPAQPRLARFTLVRGAGRATPRARIESVDPMRSLATLLLELDGDRFAASIPTRGDVTRDEDAGPAQGQVTIGVSSSDVAWFARFVGAELRLLTPEGEPLMRVRIERADSRFSVLICKVLERTGSVR